MREHGVVPPPLEALLAAGEALLEEARATIAEVDATIRSEEEPLAQAADSEDARPV